MPEPSPDGRDDRAVLAGHPDGLGLSTLRELLAFAIFDVTGQEAAALTVDALAARLWAMKVAYAPYGIVTDPALTPGAVRS